MNEATAEVLAQQLAQVLLTDGGRLVTAESCTGGGIAWLLTSIPGSSRWFERGYVTYSNESKQEVLGVPGDTLLRYGAVSEPTAAAMASGALLRSHADYCAAVTGIAGPDGGTADKPVGTVCFAWGRAGGVVRTARVRFPGDRREVRERAILLALQGLLDLVEQHAQLPGNP